jgi:Family of unknown function (DUF6282)
MNQAVTAEIQVSQRARELLRGAFDTHIHIAPDTVPRKTDDITLAHRFLELGMAGFTMKSHYNSTAERASTVNAAVPGIHALGAIALNRAVGGMNPLAVEVAAREGARTVWLPTVDSVNESHERDHYANLGPGVPAPVWVKLQLDLRAAGLEIEPVAVVDDRGLILPETTAVLERIAHHQMVLATGHLACAEIFTVVEAAQAAGVEQIVITHPEFPAEDIPVEQQLALAARGVLLERCMTTPHTGKIEWDVWIEHIRAVGAEHSVLSTDLGQVFNPPVEDGMGIMVDRLLAAGFDEQEVHVMAVTNTRRVAGVDPW